MEKTNNKIGKQDQAYERRQMDERDIGWEINQFIESILQKYSTFNIAYISLTLIQFSILVKK